MQGSAWIDLLRRIPQDLHDSLAFGLVTGEEVVVQQVLRMESDFVIVRGRMAGTTVEGRVMMVPYAHMALAAFNKPLAEDQVQAIFGKGEAAAAAAPVAHPTPVSVKPLPAPVPEPVAAPGLPSVQGPARPAPPPSKSILLARLRERLAEKAK